MITVKGGGGALNAPPIITNLRVNGNITHSQIPIAYKVSDEDLQIARHFLTVKTSSGTVINNLEITKDVGYEKPEFTYVIKNLTRETNYTIQITCSDGVISTNSQAIQAKTTDHEVFGFILDESIADPNSSSRVTYIEGASGIPPATAENGLGEWENHFPFKDLKIVAIKDNVEKEVDKNNKTQYADGSSVPVDADLFLKIPKLWTSVSKSGSKITVKLCKINIGGMRCCAHYRTNKEYNYLYIAIYRASPDGNKLRSLSNKAVGAYTITKKDYVSGVESYVPNLINVRTFARNYNQDAELHTWSSDQLLKIFYILAFKSTNKDILGNCNAASTTGSANTKGFIAKATSSTSSVFLGIEDLWGTSGGGPQYIEGLTMYLKAWTDRWEFKYCLNNGNNYSINSYTDSWENGYSEIGSPNLSNNAYNKTTFLAECMGRTDIPFCPSREVGATANTHYTASIKTPMFSYSEDKKYFYVLQESLFSVNWSQYSVKVALRLNLFKN